jgi:hypothetical protein
MASSRPEQIDILPQGGAAAVNGQHRAYFPGDIYKGAITLVTADGKQLKGRPFCLSYDDGTNTVLLAVLTNSVGVLTGSNRVVYPDAFTGIRADLVYTYRNGGFEQDVVLREQPPTPQSLGLNSRANLQLLTEFTGSPDPVQTAAAPDAQDNLQDSTLTFGAMKMVQGRAFSITASGGRGTKETPTFKGWMQLQGRTFLVEQVPYQRIAPNLKQLPMTSRLDTTGTNLLAANSFLGKVSPHRLLPPVPEAQADTEKMQLAKAGEFQKPGVVLDYVAVDTGGDLDNFTFQNGQTYYVSDSVNLTGQTTIEGGSVIKYNDENGAVNVLGSIQCSTSLVQPAILTSEFDDTVGDPVDVGYPPATGTLNITGNIQEGADATYGLGQYDNADLYDGAGNINSIAFSVNNVIPGEISWFWAAVAPWWYGSCNFYPTLNQGVVTMDGSGNLSYTECGAPLGTSSVGLSLPYGDFHGGSLNNLVFRNLNTGVQTLYGFICSATNLQFVQCGTAFDIEGGTLYAGNTLMSRVGVGFGGQDFAVTAEHLTFDQGLYLGADYVFQMGQITLVNSLLTGVLSLSDGAWVYPTDVVNLPSGSGVYQTAGPDNYYLSANCPAGIRNAGTSSINLNLLAQIQTMTTYTPQAGSLLDNDGQLDLGYHYPIMDSDGDGLADWVEVQFGTDPYNAYSQDQTQTYNDGQWYLTAVAGHTGTRMQITLNTEYSYYDGSYTHLYFNVSGAVPGNDPYNYHIYIKTASVDPSDSSPVWQDMYFRLYPYYLYNDLGPNASGGEDWEIDVPGYVPYDGSVEFAALDSQDRDFDGLQDGYEIMASHTIVGVASSQNNGVADGDAVSENDGISNLRKWQYGLNPSVPVSETDSNPANGMPDWFDNYIASWYGASADTPWGDADGDNLPNIVEYEIGTDPTTRDYWAYLPPPNGVSDESDQFVSLQRTEIYGASEGPQNNPYFPKFGMTVGPLGESCAMIAQTTSGSDGSGSATLDFEACPLNEIYTFDDTYYAYAPFSDDASPDQGELQKPDPLDGDLYRHLILDAPHLADHIWHEIDDSVLELLHPKTLLYIHAESMLEIHLEYRQIQKLMYLEAQIGKQAAIEAKIAVCENIIEADMTKITAVDVQIVKVYPDLGWASYSLHAAGFLATAISWYEEYPRLLQLVKDYEGDVRNHRNTASAGLLSCEIQDLARDLDPYFLTCGAGYILYSPDPLGWYDGYY